MSGPDGERCHAARTLAALLLAGVGVWLLLPHASPCNFSRCSGAVATAVKLAEDLSGEENIAFAFCDHAVDNYDGFRLLRRRCQLRQLFCCWTI